MFVGKYYNSIDSKSRVIVPAKFRLELGSRCIVAKALDKCLTVYPFEQWEKFVNEKLDLLPDSNPQARRLKRHFLSSAAECDVDKQGSRIWRTTPVSTRNWSPSEATELLRSGARKDGARNWMKIPGN